MLEKKILLSSRKLIFDNHRSLKHTIEKEKLQESYSKRVATLKKPHNEPYSNRIFNPVRNGTMAQKTKYEIPFRDDNEAKII